MGERSGPPEARDRAPIPLRDLPRNVWAAGLASFFMDVASEMVVNLVPLFLANVLGVRTNLIGLIEGTAEATASLLKLASGWWSDRLGSRKWLAVAGYAISAASKPLYLGATLWTAVAGARWADRVGKGIRTAPRDALVADSVTPASRGVAFGLQRGMDTAGALLGLLIALVVVRQVQAGGVRLDPSAFQTLVWLSILPAVLAVLALAIGARDVPPAKVTKAAPAAPPDQAMEAAQATPLHQPTETLQTAPPTQTDPSFRSTPAIRSAPSTPSTRARADWRGLGRPFFVFLGIVGLFDLGNSSDAFLVLRAQERGLDVAGILALLVGFNLIYALIAVPAGRLSDRLGRRPLLLGGWLLYALIYLGFGLARQAWQVVGLYLMYGVYYGLTYGTAKAMVADLVPADLRGSAFGLYNAMIGLLDVPASLLAGVLWQGIGTWPGFGPAAPFLFGSAMALAAAFGLLVWRREG